jgi:hypothetical protein
MSWRRRHIEVNHIIEKLLNGYRIIDAGSERAVFENALRQASIAAIAKRIRF